MNRLYSYCDRVLSVLLEFMFPRRCALCDCALPFKNVNKRETHFCDNCLAKIKYIKEPVCFKCGRPVTGHTSFCKSCSNRTVFYDGGKSAVSYEQFADSLYKFKYYGRSEYSMGYSELMEQAAGDWLSSLRADALIPVPLHKKRMNKRGYNQAEELAKELSKKFCIPLRTDVITRQKNTIPQKKLDRKERELNMKKAFIVNQNDVKLKTVVLIDDIFTTGSTINSMAEELKKHGVTKVFFFTVSSAGT